MKQNTSQEKQLQKELLQLYKRWPEIKLFLRKLGCDLTTAEDVFQEALLIYVRKKESPDFVLTVEPHVYLVNVCKLIWYNLARKQQKNQTVQLEVEVQELTDEWMVKELKIQKVETAIQQLGQKCKDLLHLFYNQNWSLSKIAQKLDFRSENVAKVQKCRCLQKAKDLVDTAGVNVESIQL